MTARVVETYEEHTPENEAFGEQLKAWLLRHGVEEQMHGVVFIALLTDGFDLLYLGPKAPSTEELQAWVINVAQSLVEVQGPE